MHISKSRNHQETTSRTNIRGWGITEKGPNKMPSQFMSRLELIKKHYGIREGQTIEKSANIRKFQEILSIIYKDAARFEHLPENILLAMLPKPTSVLASAMILHSKRLEDQRFESLTDALLIFTAKNGARALASTVSAFENYSHFIEDGRLSVAAMVYAANKSDAEERFLMLENASNSKTAGLNTVGNFIGGSTSEELQGFKTFYYLKEQLVGYNVAIFLYKNNITIERFCGIVNMAETRGELRELAEFIKSWRNNDSVPIVVHNGENLSWDPIAAFKKLEVFVENIGLISSFEDSEINYMIFRLQHDAVRRAFILLRHKMETQKFALNNAQILGIAKRNQELSSLAMVAIEIACSGVPDSGLEVTVTKTITGLLKALNPVEFVGRLREGPVGQALPKQKDPFLPSAAALIKSGDGKPLDVIEISQVLEKAGAIAKLAPLACELKRWLITMESDGINPRKIQRKNSPHNLFHTLKLLIGYFEIADALAEKTYLTLLTYPAAQMENAFLIFMKRASNPRDYNLTDTVILNFARYSRQKINLFIFLAEIRSLIPPDGRGIIKTSYLVNLIIKNKCEIVADFFMGSVKTFYGGAQIPEWISFLLGDAVKICSIEDYSLFPGNFYHGQLFAYLDIQIIKSIIKDEEACKLAAHKLKEYILLPYDQQPLLSEIREAGFSSEPRKAFYFLDKKLVERIVSGPVCARWYEILNNLIERKKIPFDGLPYHQKILSNIERAAIFRLAIEGNSRAIEIWIYFHALLVTKVVGGFMRKYGITQEEARKDLCQTANKIMLQMLNKKNKKILFVTYLEQYLYGFLSKEFSIRIRYLKPTISLDTPKSSGDEKNKKTLLDDTPSLTKPVDEELSNQATIGRVREAVAVAAHGDRVKEVIAKRRLLSDEPATFKELKIELGVGEITLRKIERQMFVKLRALLSGAE